MEGQIKLILLFSFIFAVLIPGCSDSIISPDGTTGTVSGRIFDEEGFPVANAHISIQNKNTVINEDGTFSLGGVTIPYDIKYWSTRGGKFYGTVFEELRTFTPVLPGVSDYSLHEYCNVNFSFPVQLTNDQRGKILFTDDDNVFAHELFGSNSTTHHFRIKWFGREIVSGKLFLLIYETENHEFSKYKYYAEVPYTIETFKTQHKTFTESELQPITEDRTVSVEVTVPDGFFTGVNIGLYMKVGKGNYNRVRIGGSYTGFNYITAKVPVGLPSNFSFYFYSRANAPGLASTDFFKKIVTESSINQIFLPPPVILESPKAGSEGVNYNTMFYFTPTSGVGVYKLTFNNNENSVSVYTGKNYAKFPVFEGTGNLMGSEENFNWYVEKFNIPIDDYVSSRLEFNQRLTSITKSSQRGFTTE